MKRAPFRSSLVSSSLLSASLLVGCIPIDEGHPEPFPAVPRGPAPSFGQTVTLDKAPPPMSGGTLLMTRDGTTAVAADPDRDRVVLVDVAGRSLRATVALPAGSEPGRAIEDKAGLVHVVLRGAGEIADIAPSTGAIVGRRAVCPAPRGIGYVAGRNELLVACAGGELVHLPAASGAATRTSQVARDLRDVVVDGDGTVMVTRMRTADVLVIDALDNIVDHARAPSANMGFGDASPNTAWRTVAIPGGGGVLMTHQRASEQVVQTTPGGYGEGGGDSFCGPSGASIVHSTATVFRQRGGVVQSAAASPILADVVLPVDVAVTGDGQRAAVVSAGNAYVPGASQVTVVALASLDGRGSSCEFSLQETRPVEGEAIAVAYAKSGDLFVQTREPSTLQIVAGSVPANSARSVVIPLGGESRFDTGFAVFHANSSAGLACASCHAEGGDDARTWQFADLGPRRTQSLRGGIVGRAPYHWSGDEADFTNLVSDVFVGRMSGPQLDDGQTRALTRWVDGIPALPAPAIADANAVVRGRQLFNDPKVGCASCHSGALHTDNRMADVGTTGRFKTPSLVNVAARAPFMHDGCAPTLRDRFTSTICGGGDQHGTTSKLAPTQIDDLVAYLETL